MSERLTSATVAEKAIVHSELPRLRREPHELFEKRELGLIEALARPCEGERGAVAQPNIRQDVDRTFEMPSAFYVATVALYLGFIAMLGIGFATEGLLIPMAIFAIFIVGLFAAPGLWLRVGPKPRSRALSVGELMRSGIQTNTGLLKGRDAAVQMMVLPVLIVVWGGAVLTIAAMVGA
ncbi:MAG: hypothetical protein GW855_00675 [Erythrobacter sp.]|nr:hypothetical protein [Erythrobacter sp.]NCQ64244.1 hypothetical protein [Alphaproteobacteria bacterium]